MKQNRTLDTLIDDSIKARKRLEWFDKYIYKPMMVIAAIVMIIIFFLLGTSVARAQTLSERIDNFEYESHSTIYHGWPALYHWANDRDLGFKAFAVTTVGFTIGYSIHDHRNYGCKLSWWEKRKARRQHRKRRRR